MSDLNSEFLFELRLAQGADGLINMGTTPWGQLMYSAADQGTFAGPKLNGIVIPYSGGDWPRVRGDMTIAVDVRLVLKTNDGANIYMVYRGIMAANTPADIPYMIDATKKDDILGSETRYYYRTLIEFETGDPRYAWLNRTLAVGKGRLGDNQAIYEVFAIR